MTMRASEALIAGSTMMKAMPYRMTNEDQSLGCALGMMGKAMGCACCTGSYFGWLHEDLKVLTPCGCSYNLYPAGTADPDIDTNYLIASYWGCVAHIFNQHVCGDKTWTIEQLADWVESVDPTPKVKAAEEHSLFDSSSSNSLRITFGMKTAEQEQTTEVALAVK